MKRTVLGLMLLAAVTGQAFADERPGDQIDETFTRARSWLNQHDLSLTGSPSGRDDGAAFRQEAILFYGEGIGNPDGHTPAQREQGAKRAAEVIAQRAVAEYLNGFALVGDTLVLDGMQKYDSVRSAVNGVVKGVEVVCRDYSTEKDAAIAIVKVGLHGPKGFGSAIYEKMFKDPELKKSLTEVDGKQAVSYRHKVEPLEQSYDGLIVDATGQNFKPALINRIFSGKKELLYDPSKVSQKILVEQGCGEYTNSVEKAKAALRARGVGNPLVVRATGTVSPADLQVSDDDASAIFSANQKRNFLAGANVAFVLK